MLTSVNKIAVILRTFRLDRPELSLAELSRAVNMPKPTVYKLVGTLTSCGFLDKDEITKRYRPSIRMFEMSQLILRNIDLIREATPFIQLLAKESGETAHLTYYDNGEVIYVLKVENQQVVQLYSRVGRRAPAAASACGKAILAFSEDHEIQAVLTHGWKPLTSKTIENEGRFLKDLEHTRQLGYSVQMEEVDIGIASVGAPIFDHTSRPVAAISIAGPVNSFTPNRIRYHGRSVKGTASMISERLGYQPSRAKILDR